MKTMKQFLAICSKKQCFAFGTSFGLMAAGLLMGISGCKTQSAATTAYTTISAVETAVTQANLGYLDSVVTGATPTNGVPTVEAAFNATQMALRAAAAIASGGTNAAVPATVMAQATAFTNTVIMNSVKTK